MKARQLKPTWRTKRFLTSTRPLHKFIHPISKLLASPPNFLDDDVKTLSQKAENIETSRTTSGTYTYLLADSSRAWTGDSLEKVGSSPPSNVLARHRRCLTGAVVGKSCCYVAEGPHLPAVRCSRIYANTFRKRCPRLLLTIAYLVLYRCIYTDHVRCYLTVSM